MRRAKSARPARKDETALFIHAMRDARPLQPSARAGQKGAPEPAAANPRKPAAVRAAPAKTSRPPPKPPKLKLFERAWLTGLDGANARRLARGKLEIEARLDLHGRTGAAAQLALSGFIQRAYAAGKRCVLVITGKGRAREDKSSAHGRLNMPQRKGVLFEMAPRWLTEGELAPYVVAFHPAHAKHGGGGALYVYLRRGRAG